MRLKYELIGTPLQRPAETLRDLLDARRLIRRPEQYPLWREPFLIRRVLKRALNPDSCCADIGCHYGSVLAEITRLAPKGRHIAFEPTPDKAAFIRRKFPEVDVRELALSDVEGTTTFFIDTRRSGYSGLTESAQSDNQAIEVTVSTLDRELADVQRLDFLKIDVEGAETLLFRGAAEALSRLKPLMLFECGPTMPKAGGATIADCYHEVTERLGYNIYLMENWLKGEAPVALDDFEAALKYPFKAFNWIAVSKA